MCGTRMAYGTTRSLSNVRYGEGVRRSALSGQCLVVRSQMMQARAMGSRCGVTEVANRPTLSQDALQYWASVLLQRALCGTARAHGASFWTTRLNFGRLLGRAICGTERAYGAGRHGEGSAEHDDSHVRWSRALSSFAYAVRCAELKYSCVLPHADIAHSPCRM